MKPKVIKINFTSHKYFNPIRLNILKFRAKTMPQIRENDKGLANWQPLVGNRVNVIILYFMDLGTTAAWLCTTAIINPVHHMMYPVHHIMYPVHHIMYPVHHMMATPIHHMMDL